MNATPAAYSLPLLIPGWTVEFDSAPVFTKFQDYGIHVSGVVTENATGRRYRCHMYASRAAVPSDVQLNYLGKRAGAPVQANHVPNAWAIVRAAWHDVCVDMRDEMATNPVDRESLSGPERAALRRAERDAADVLAGDLFRRKMNREAAGELPAAFDESVSVDALEPRPVSPAERAAAVPVDDLETEAAARLESPLILSEAAPVSPVRLHLRDMAAALSAQADRENPATVALQSARTIDCTPTWAAILPLIRAALANGTPTGRRMAWEELERMAAAADTWNRFASPSLALASAARALLAENTPGTRSALRVALDDMDRAAD